MTLISRQICTFISTKALEYLIMSLTEFSRQRRETQLSFWKLNFSLFEGKNYNYFKIKG